MSGFPLFVWLLVLFLASWGGRAAVAAQGVTPQFPLLLLLGWTLPGDLLLLEELGQAGLQLGLATYCGLLICTYSYKGSSLERLVVCLTGDRKLRGMSMKSHYCPACFQQIVSKGWKGCFWGCTYPCGHAR